MRRQPLKNFKGYGLPQRLSSTNFTWFIFEYLDPNILWRFTWLCEFIDSFACLDLRQSYFSKHYNNIWYILQYYNNYKFCLILSNIFILSHLVYSEEKNYNSLLVKKSYTKPSKLIFGFYHDILLGRDLVYSNGKNC